MASIRYDHKRYELAENQSVLDCLNGHSVPVPYSCRVGVCQTCLMCAKSGTPPTSAQVGLKDSLKFSGHFLACVFQPTEDLDVTLPDEALLSSASLQDIHADAFNVSHA